jgi:hypothetical protein
VVVLTNDGSHLVLRALLAAAILLGPLSASAQWALDLTGKPAKTAPEAFTHVAGVRQLPGDRAVVTDQMEHRLFLVDFARGESRQIGRDGDGPGEYRFPMAPHAASGDSTFVLDATLRRMLVIAPDGRFGPSLSPPYAAVLGGFTSARGTDTRSRVYFEGNGFDRESGRFMDSVTIYRWEPGAPTVVSMARFWNGGRVRVMMGGMSASVARTGTPFPAIDAWVALPDGRVAVVHHAPFQIVVSSLDAIPVRSATIPHTPIKITAAERDAYRARETGAKLVAGGGNQTIRRPPTSDEVFPAEMPPFIAASVLASPDGLIWVGRSFQHTDRARSYDVFDSSGKLVGRASTTLDRAIVGFGAGSVYVARTDPADNLVYLERFVR